MAEVKSCELLTNTSAASKKFLRGLNIFTYSKCCHGVQMFSKTKFCCKHIKMGLFCIQINQGAASWSSTAGVKSPSCSVDIPLCVAKKTLCSSEISFHTNGPSQRIEGIYYLSRFGLKRELWVPKNHTISQSLHIFAMCHFCHCQKELTTWIAFSRSISWDFPRVRSSQETFTKPTLFTSTSWNR